MPMLKDLPYFLKKIQHENNNNAWALLNFNIQHSIRTRILFPYIASYGKGCQIIRRAKFLEEVW